MDTEYCTQAECPPVTIDRAAELHSNTDKIITAHPFGNSINFNYEWHFTGYGDCSAQCLGGTTRISCIYCHVLLWLVGIVRSMSDWINFN